MNPLLSPSYDNKIFHKYSARTLEGKVQNKLREQEELGWPREPKIPLLILPSGMSEEMGGTLFEEVLPGILSLSCQILVRGKGSQRYGEIFTTLEKEHPHRVHIVKDDPTVQRKLYAAADMGLFFAPMSRDDEETGNCLSYGVVPIAPPYDPLWNYDPVQEAGNSFTADPLNHWTWFAALARACETFKLPFDWRTIQRSAMETAKREE